MLTTGYRWRGVTCILARLARPPPRLLRIVCVKGKGFLLRQIPSPDLRGRRVVPVPASGVGILRGPIPRPSTIPILPRSTPKFTLPPS
jgi:hypothetical protein